MQALFFGPSATLDVVLTNLAGRLSTTPSEEAGAGGGGGPPPAFHIYSSGEDIVGEARVVVPPGKKLEHVGIRVELKGVIGECGGSFLGWLSSSFRRGIGAAAFFAPISRASLVAELFGDRSGGHEFASTPKELARPETLPGGTHLYKFSFPKSEMPYESYDGINARCRYFVRVTVSRSSYASSNLVKDAEFIVRNVEAVRPMRNWRRAWSLWRAASARVPFRLHSSFAS